MADDIAALIGTNLSGASTPVEMLGRETFIGIAIEGGTRFTVHAEPDVPVRQGDRVVFGLERGRLYLFDPRTEPTIARV